MTAARVSLHGIIEWFRGNRELIQKCLISTFVILYVSINVAFLSPKNAFTNAITDSIKNWWFFVGFQQRWELFSPKIRTLNVHTVALITFENGTSTLWQLPRLEHMNAWDKFSKDKFRKWAGDSVPWEPYKQFWPDLARYIGRIHYDPKNKPVSLTLMRLSADIPPPSRAVPRDKFPEHTQFSSAFTYKFRPEDFR